MTCTFPHEYRSGHRQSNGMAHDHLYHYLAQFLASIHFPTNSKQEVQVKWIDQCILLKITFDYIKT